MRSAFIFVVAANACSVGAAPCSEGTMCRGECVDTTVDALNCGRCGATCGADTFCEASHCVQAISAPMLTFVSEPSSVDPNSDSSHTLSLTVTFVDDYEPVAAFNFDSDTLTIERGPLGVTSTNATTTITVTIPPSQTELLAFKLAVVAKSGLASVWFTSSVVLN